MPSAAPVISSATFIAENYNYTPIQHSENLKLSVGKTTLLITYLLKN